jgi:hypothetical protein
LRFTVDSYKKYFAAEAILLRLFVFAVLGSAMICIRFVVFAIFWRAVDVLFSEGGKDHFEVLSEEVVDTQQSAILRIYALEKQLAVIYESLTFSPCEVQFKKDVRIIGSNLFMSNVNKIRGKGNIALGSMDISTTTNEIVAGVAKFDTLDVAGGGATISGVTTLNELNVLGSASFSSAVAFNNSTLAFNSSTLILNLLNVTGDTTLNGNLHVLGTTTADAAATFGSTLNVAGVTTFQDQVGVVNANLYVSGSSAGKGNVVIGTGHTVTGRNSVVSGINHNSSADNTAVLGGSEHTASATGCVAIGGYRAAVSGDAAVAVGGWYASAHGPASAVFGGLLGNASGNLSVAVGSEASNASGSLEVTIGPMLFTGGGLYSTLAKAYIKPYAG